MAIRVDPPCPEARAQGRTIWRLSPRDEARWRGLADRAAPLIEARLPVGVLADRAVREPPGWRLAPMRPALLRARLAAAALARRGAVVATDVEAFFASVTPRALGRGLAGLGMAREDARLGEIMLEGWGEHGHRGLPVGPAASSILANAVLLPVDLRLSPRPFLRWVDDYLLPADLPMERFDEALAAMGLRRSERKTVDGVRGVWRIPYVRRPGRASA